MSLVNALDISESDMSQSMPYLIPDPVSTNESRALRVLDLIYTFQPVDKGASRRMVRTQRECS